jgi:DNA-directed RNA polymerase specialized sigma24 family protein
MAPGDGSVSRWLGQLQGGDALAVRPLWQRYFHRLVELARQRLRGSARRVADEEDVALSALDSFCRAAEQGRFPDLADRDSLWRLLVVMTARKANQLGRDEGRQKRGGALQPVAEMAGEGEEALLDQLLSHEPTPEVAAQMREECARLLGRLGDEELRQVALLRLEGYTVEEVAARLGCVARSVKRKLHLIRNIWEKERTP